MNDPHVVSLTYRVRHSDTVDFDRAPPVSVDRGSFRITLHGGKAKVEMVDHFASEEEARKVVERYLESWQFQADLNDPGDAFRFTYEAAEVIDQSPPPPGGTISGSGAMTAAAASVRAEFTARASKGAWPKPPQDLELSFDAETMRRRWIRHCVKQGEPLLAAAYWALTMLEAAPGVATPSMRPGSKTRSKHRRSKKRLNAGAFFNIEYDLLDKLGDLVSTRGGEEEGRKAEGRITPLSSAEKEWVKAAFCAIVRRVAEREHHKGPPPRPLTMKDLPP